MSSLKPAYIFMIANLLLGMTPLVSFASSTPAMVRCEMTFTSPIMVELARLKSSIDEKVDGSRSIAITLRKALSEKILEARELGFDLSSLPRLSSELKRESRENRRDEDKRRRIVEKGEAHLVPLLPSRRLTGDTGEDLEAVTTSADGRMAATRFNHRVVIWNVQDGRKIQELLHPDGWIFASEFSLDGRAMVTTVRKSAMVWDIATGKAQRNLGHPDSVTGARFSPSGKYILTGDMEGAAKIWDARTGAPLSSLQGHTQHINEALFSPNEQYAITNSADHQVFKWDVTTGQQLHHFDKLRDRAYSVAISPDSQLIFTSDVSGLAFIWEAATGRVLHEFTGLPARTAKFSPDGKTLVVSVIGQGARVAALDVLSGQEVMVVKEKTAALGRPADFSPDGKWLAIMIENGDSFVWDTATWTPKVNLGRGSAVTFTPDGRHVITTLGHEALVFDIPPAWSE